MVMIGIIGSAGRKGDGPRLSRDIYFKMVRDAEDLPIGENGELPKYYSRQR